MYNCNLFQMKFASNSYNFQLVLKQNYCIGIQQNSHKCVNLFTHFLVVIHMHFLYSSYAIPIHLIFL